jgi:hypothetical protein
MESTPRTAWSRICISRAAAMSFVAAISRAEVSLHCSACEDKSSCSHVIAANFHPEGQRPKAACPTCIKEKNDRTVRDLYSIRGFQKDEHDSMIPSAWFVAPPISFDANGKEIEALRVWSVT